MVGLKDSAKVVVGNQFSGRLAKKLNRETTRTMTVVMVRSLSSGPWMLALQFVDFLRSFFPCERFGFHSFILVGLISWEIARKEGKPQTDCRARMRLDDLTGKRSETPGGDPGRAWLEPYDIIGSSGR